MFKLLRLFIIVGLALGLGYYLGSLQEEKVQEIFKSFRFETSSKVSGLEREVRSLQLKVHLTTARDQLGSAREDILGRNFGNAEKKIMKAKKELQKAIAMVPEKTGKALHLILKGVDPVIPMLQRSDQGASSRVKRLEDHLIKFIDDQAR